MREATDRWDLDWEPDSGAGAPSRLPPTNRAVYAELPLRAMAFVIDLALGLVLSQLAAGALGLIAGWASRAPNVEQESALLAASLTHVALSVLVTLSVVYLWRTFRGTPGQLALRLVVLRQGSGLTLSRRDALVRWLLLYLPMAFVLSYQTLGTALARIPATEELDQFLVAGAALLLPIAWWLVLGLSLRGDRRRGRGLHDRLARSVVVRRLGD